MFYGEAFISGFLSVVGGKLGGTDSGKKSQRKRRKEGLKEVGARGREDAKENCDILLVSTLGPFLSL